MFGQYLKNNRIFAVLYLGFSSGLPLALTSSTLQAWFTEAGVSLMTIGMLSLVGIPYLFKFLWAPVLDRFVPPLWGRRRGWILVTQLGLCAALFILAQLIPKEQAPLIGFIALMIAFLSASQDIAIDAYRTDLLLPEERGLGAAAVTLGFRMAMLVSGGLALILADQLGWRLTYEIMAEFLSICIIGTYFAPELSEDLKPPATFFAAIVEPFKDLLNREKIFLIVLFIIFYKFGDAFALSLMSNFLLGTLKFSLTEIGLAFKIFGLVAMIVGAITGGILLTRINLFQALLWFGLLQTFSTLVFVFLAIVGKNYVLMITSVAIESFCSGLSAAAFVSFIMYLCNKRYSATQYASLSALSALSRIISGPFAAIMIEHLGWIGFFSFAFIFSFPGLILLSLLRNKVIFNVEATV